MLQELTELIKLYFMQHNYTYMYTYIHKYKYIAYLQAAPIVMHVPQTATNCVMLSPATLVATSCCTYTDTYTRILMNHVNYTDFHTPLHQT